MGAVTRGETWTRVPGRPQGASTEHTLAAYHKRINKGGSQDQRAKPAGRDEPSSSSAPSAHMHRPLTYSELKKRQLLKIKCDLEVLLVLNGLDGRIGRRREKTKGFILEDEVFIKGGVKGLSSHAEVRVG